MPIHRLAVSGYRSLRDIVLGLDRLTVVTGANGSGKSSLYRALRLLAEVAQGRAIPSLAREGGFASALWAGPETFGRRVLDGSQRVEGTVRRRPVELKLGFSDDEVGYAIALGLPPPSFAGTFFAHDPEIKAESVWTGPIVGRANVFAERRGPLVRLRDGTGTWTEALRDLPAFDSLMTHGADPRDALDVLMLRERMRAWRFYDHVRTDRDAPARRPQIGTRTPVLAGDGADVAAAIRTIWRSATGTPSTRPSPRPFRGRRCRWRAARTTSPSNSASTGCCARCAARNSPTGRCATSCSPRRSCRRARPS